MPGGAGGLGHEATAPRVGRASLGRKEQRVGGGLSWGGPITLQDNAVPAVSTMLPQTLPVALHNATVSKTVLTRYAFQSVCKICSIPRMLTFPFTAFTLQ